MRILYAADSSPNPDFASNLWRANLHDSLVALGHEVVEFQHDMGETFRHLADADFISRNRPVLSQALLSQVAAVKPEMLFTYFYDACVEPDTVRHIRSMGVTTVNWFCNASYQLDMVSEISPHYDWCLVPERYRLDDYRALGARPLYCQEAASPRMYHPHDVGQEYDVAFAGQCYADRPEVVLWLREQGLDVRVWGTRWEHHVSRRSRHPFRFFKRPRGLPASSVGGVLTDADLVKLYSRARINLGFATVGETHQGQRISQVRLRDFEVPMSGGFYLAEHSEELSDFFTPGVEIETWRNSEELLEKCRYYLTHEAERRRIAAAGRARALREHTWEHRFANAFCHMGLS